MHLNMTKEQILRKYPESSPFVTESDTSKIISLAESVSDSMRRKLKKERRAQQMLLQQIGIKANLSSFCASTINSSQCSVIQIPESEEDKKTTKALSENARTEKKSSHDSAKEIPIPIQEDQTPKLSSFKDICNDQVEQVKDKAEEMPKIEVRSMFERSQQSEIPTQLQSLQFDS
jgi:hypothetical protein